MAYWAGGWPAEADAVFDIGSGGATRAASVRVVPRMLHRTVWRKSGRFEDNTALQSLDSSLVSSQHL